MKLRRTKNEDDNLFQLANFYRRNHEKNFSAVHNLNKVKSEIKH